MLDRSSDVVCTRVMSMLSVVRLLVTLCEECIVRISVLCLVQRICNAGHCNVSSTRFKHAVSAVSAEHGAVCLQGVGAITTGLGFQALLF